MLRRTFTSYVAWACLCALNSTGCQGAEQAAPILHTQYGRYNLRTDTVTELRQLEQNPSDRSVKIVQFVGPIQPAWRQILVDRGLPIRGYMPDHALVVVATDQDAVWLRSLPVVHAVIDQPHLWRIDPRLVHQGPLGPELNASLGVQDLLVELADAGARQQVEALVNQAGGTLLTPPLAEGRVLHVRMHVGGAAVLAAHPDVASVEPFTPLRVFNDASYGVIQANERHKAPLWDHGLHGEGQVVGVCDVGVFTNSCYFPSEKIVQYENVTPVTQHDQSHGTHTAGSIAGDNLGNGTYDLDDGMAPAARLYVQDAGTITPGELALPPDLGVLFGTAYNGGARIHSDSWGGDTNIYSARERTLDAFVAAHRDFLVVMANGNAGNQDGTVGSPATAKNLISVGASDNSTGDDVAAFTSHGPTSDGRFKPTLVAPGVQVMSASSTFSCGVAAKSGTSMATPVVAGAAALVRQYYTDGFYPTGEGVAEHAMAPSAALLKATLVASADDVTGQYTDGSFPANGQGFGRVHLDNALYFPGDASRLWVRDDQEGLDQGQDFAVSLQVTASEPLHVALTWMDEPGTPGSARALVNDLDLQLVGPDGSVYLGNNLVGGASRAGGSADSANVEEMVYLPQPRPGTYTLKIHAANVPMGPQPYAVVVVGDVNGATGDGVVPSATHVNSVSDKAAVVANNSGRVGCSSADGVGGVVALACVAWLMAKRRESAGN